MPARVGGDERAAVLEVDERAVADNHDGLAGEPPTGEIRGAGE